MNFFDELLESRPQKPIINGVIRGVVKENWDEKKQGKVKVEFYMGETGKSLSSWIPVAMPYTGNKAGFYMLPEVGCEVVVGFEMGNPECPIVLGSLWNNKAPLPDETPEKENMVKRIKTRGGHQILFREEKDKGILQINTPKELTVKLEDEPEKITIQDKNGDNLLILDGKNGAVALSGKKKLELQIGGKSLITLENDKVTIGAGTVSVEGKQSLKIQSQSADVKSNMLGIKADASLKIESGAMLEVKGAMVKLN